MFDIIIDTSNLSILKTLQEKLSKLENTRIVTYETIKNQVIIFKEIASIHDLKNFSPPKMNSHSIIFIIDNQELMFLSLSYYPLCFIRKNDLETDLEHAISLLLNLHKNIERILTFKIGYSYIQIKINQIIWIESFGHYLIIHTLLGQYKIREKLSRLLDELAIEQFIQVHKSYIVNQNYIDIRKSNEIVLKNKTVIPIGRKFKNAN